MGYKGRHRAPPSWAMKLRIPAVLTALTSPVGMLFVTPATVEEPVPPSPSEITYPTMEPVTAAPVTPSATPTPTPTPTPAPTPTKTPEPKKEEKRQEPQGLTFPSSGPSYGGTKAHVRRAGWLIDSLYPVDSIIGVGPRANVSDHPKGLALDFMVHSKSQGDAIASFVLSHMDLLDVKYVIWRQRINYGDGWEPMEDRGGATANHFDHVHVSFYS